MKWSRTDAGIIAALVCLSAIPYARVATFEFVALDDSTYLNEYNLVQRGLDPLALWDAWGFHFENWHPLVWWSYMLDFQIFGLDSAAFHLENLAWHLADVALLYAALRELTADRWRSAFVAAVFGVHPLHVESVAWISERKDVLSAFWWMLGIWAYAFYGKTGQLRYWRLVTLFLTLGLMTKQIVVTLPCVFLLLDAWPLDRWRDPQSGRLSWQRARALISEKVPWFLLVAISCWLAMQAQQTAKEARGDWPLALRLANSTLSGVRYLAKTFWPTRLSVQYPLNPPESMVPVLAAAVLLITVTVVLIIVARRTPAALVGWLWYLGVLTPVIGLVQTGKQAMADRYMYLPLIGLAITVAWLIPTPRSRTGLWLYGIAAGLALSALTIRSAQQANVWKNTDRLYSQTLLVDPTNETARYFLAWRDIDEGRLEEGLDHLHAAVEWDQRRWVARRKYGIKRADPEYAELSRRWAAIHFALGQAEAKRQRTDAAIAELREAVKLDPQLHEARLLLGTILLDENQPEAALVELDEVLKRQPQNAQAVAGREEVLRRLEKRSIQ